MPRPHQMTKTTSLKATDRKACCGTALANTTTCDALCLGATQDPATCVPTGRRLLEAPYLGV
jgi:hypothetical protein